MQSWQKLSDLVKKQPEGGWSGSYMEIDNSVETCDDDDDNKEIVCAWDYDNTDYSYDLLAKLEHARSLELKGDIADNNGYQYFHIDNNIESLLKRTTSFPTHLLKDQQSDKRNDLEWSASASYSEAVDRVINPYKYYTKDIDQIWSLADEKLTVNSVNFQEEEIYDYEVAGEYLDINRHLEGFTDVFLRGSKSTLQGNTFIKLVVTHSRVHGGVDPDVVKHYTANVSTLVAMLAKNKIPVAIDYIMWSTTNFVKFPIKSYQEHLDLASLYAVCHPSFFRRIIFRAIEMSQNYQWGYGAASIELKIDRYQKYKNENIIILTVNDSLQDMLDKIKKFKQ